MNKISTQPTLSKLENFGVKRDGRWLVRHVDIVIKDREIVTIVGPNGSGKSTIIKALAGLLEPDEGRIENDDTVTIGYVPQLFSINPSMPLTVARMMALGNRLSDAKMDEILAKFKISHLANHDIHSLSGGEYQRMALARALIHRPRLLLLDEPTKGIDINGQVDLFDYIQRYRDENNAAIVLVSHDLHLVAAATDRVICMNGHVCCSGTPQKVANDPEFRNMFGDHVRDRLAIYRHEHDHVHLADRRVQHPDGTITNTCNENEHYHGD